MNNASRRALEGVKTVWKYEHSFSGGNVCAHGVYVDQYLTLYDVE